MIQDDLDKLDIIWSLCVQKCLSLFSGGEESTSPWQTVHISHPRYAVKVKIMSKVEKIQLLTSDWSDPKLDGQLSVTRGVRWLPLKLSISFIPALHLFLYRCSGKLQSASWWHNLSIFMLLILCHHTHTHTNTCTCAYTHLNALCPTGRHLLIIIAQSQQRTCDI